MNVSVRIVVAQRRDVVRIPLEAVTLAGRRRGSVSVVGPAGRTVRRTVMLGLSDNEHVEVLRGLRTGEHVALAAGGEDA
jgi:multidrug efflux pump subunit AcrA (membrane-fusion protein)